MGNIGSCKQQGEIMQRIATSRRIRWSNENTMEVFVGWRGTLLNKQKEKERANRAAWKTRTITHPENEQREKHLKIDGWKMNFPFSGGSTTTWNKHESIPMLHSPMDFGEEQEHLTETSNHMPLQKSRTCRTEVSYNQVEWQTFLITLPSLPD